MACFSATQLHTLLWTSSLNRTSHHFKPNYTYRTPKFLFRQKPLIASFSTSDVEARTETKDSSTATLRELCHGHVPEHVIRRVEEVGYVIPTEVQLQALPFLYSGRDCVLHAQTGSGKTLAYLLQILSVIDSQRSAVQALIVVPTRELGMQVTKVARMLAAKPSELESGPKSCTVMALLDGGMLNRHKSWLKAEPPTIVVATMGSLCQMLEKHILKLDSCQVLVVDEVCTKREKNQVLLSLLQVDSPESAIIFVSEQSEKSKKAGNAPPITLLVDFLMSSSGGFSNVSLLEEDMNFNKRAASLSELRGGGGYLLVATDIAARGVDLPETTHIYNFDIPKDAVNYLHRAGRTGRKPFSDKKCFVTSIITVEERFVLQRFENELMFCCEQLFF
ncbi:DEAD-box ATP-dependent RNA helicase 58, chloroplastic isoform X2 [Nicotiana tabacum]|uniref:DEAD-box ATP-dependent RNA helicase 58, chloroplastic isoform X2 n=1 Tax=Nicotiana tabacum TaxID=4097 RepID=A0AC58SKY0_TOBAC